MWSIEDISTDHLIGSGGRRDSAKVETIRQLLRDSETKNQVSQLHLDFFIL